VWTTPFTAKLMVQILLESKITSTTFDRCHSPNAREVRESQATSRRCAWLFAIALFGYPIVGNLIALSQVDSRVLSIPFRIVVIVFSLWVIITTKPLRLDRWRQLMLLLWFLYILRLIHDWLFTNLEGADFALQYFVASSVFPAIALMKARAFQPRKFAQVSFVIASLGAVASLFIMLSGNTDAQDAGSSGRLSVTALNPASLAYEATSAILCGLVVWRDASMSAKLCIAVVSFALIWCVVLTGSKGPALALLICGALWSFRNRQTWKFALLAVPVLIAVMVSEDNPLAARLSVSEDDQSTVVRLVILGDSIKQIADSPLIGSAFVEYNSGFYPHNVFVEAALALGIPCALLFLALMSFGVWSSWRTLRGENALLGLLFFQALFAATTSGAIWGAILLWVTVAMLPKLRSPVSTQRRTKIDTLSGGARIIAS
jgi:O-antigen ligase